MAGKGKRKISALKKYNLLRKEAMRLNASLPEKKRLSPKEVYRFVSEKLYPAYQQTAVSRIRKGELRDFGEKQIKRYTRQLHAPAAPTTITYGYVQKRLTALNAALPIERKLSYNERNQIASTAYRELKGKSVRKYGKNVLNRLLEAEIAKKPKKIDGDVLAIDPTVYNQGTPYYDIGPFVENTLPPNIHVMINAGDQFGRTPIFDTLNYNYYRNGLADITNRINAWWRSLPEKKRNSSKVPLYFGEIQVRPERENDGNPDSYYLEMILFVGDIPAERKAGIQLPERKLTRKAEARARKTTTYVKEKTSKMQAEKSKVKGIRQRIEKAINDAETIFKQKFISKAEKDRFAAEAFNSWKAKLDKYLQNKTLTEPQHESLFKRIKKGYRQ